MAPGGGAACAARETRLCAAALALALAMSGPGAAQTGGPPGGGPGGEDEPREVGVVTLSEEAVPYTLTLPGRAVAFEEAAIRPRVSGAIEEVAYEPGRPVAAGDLLFRIEDDTYAAALAAAEAGVAGAEAALATAVAAADRARSLEGSAVTTAAAETAESARSQAEAALAAARAALETARLDLSRTAILSPIDGLPDIAAVSVGELVTANQAEALATVTRLDPIYVDMAESSARMLRLRDRIDQGTLLPGDEVGLRLVLETGESYEGAGAFVSPGTAVSTTTGTLDLRVRFDNPDRRILPGQFLRVEVTAGTQRGILVPQRATSRGPDGALTAFVAREGAAEEVALTTTGTHDNGWIVTSGVAVGELLIVDGLNNLEDGDAVAPVPVTIDPSGVVLDVPVPGAADAPATADAAAPAAQTASGG